MELLVGRVAKVHGLGGELAVEPRTDAPDLRFAISAVLTALLRDGTRRRVTVLSSRPHQDRLLVRFAEVEDRAAADELRGAPLLVDSADLPPSSDPEEFYDHELEGLLVRTLDGVEIGRVAEVRHGSGPELLAVASERGEVLVPFVHQIVPEIDLVAGVLVVDPPEGLFEQ